MSNRGEIECWLTDMDGVLVHENHPIPGASKLLQQWRDQGKPYLVLTNNSIFTPRDLSARLRAVLRECGYGTVVMGVRTVQSSPGTQPGGPG